jgi:hypothetical protein
MSRQGGEPHRYANRMETPKSGSALARSRSGRSYRLLSGYFRVPAVRPAWTWRWKERYTTSTGSIAITMPANSAG